MPRLKKKNKIISLANKIIAGAGNHKEAAELPASIFMSRLVHDSEDGFIRNYSKREITYVNEVFQGSFTEYYKAITELFNLKLVTKNNNPDVLYIKPFSERHFINLVIFSKQHVRKYLKDLDREKENLNKRIYDGKFGSISGLSPDASTSGSPFIFTEKAKGFIVPIPLFPYLTGEPLPEDQITALLKYNSELLVLEGKRRDLNKEDKRVYCACMAFSDRYGEIKDYNIHSLIECIRKDFGMRSFAAATVYNSINKLLDLKLISEYTDKAGRKNLKIERYKECLEEKSRYVIIPNAVFDCVFKKLCASAVKLFFFILERLNNGDNSNGYEGQNKAFYFKFAKLCTNDQEARDKYNRQLLWLRKRYDNELDTLLFGSLDDTDFLSLADYFYFYKSSDTSYQVRIRHEYFISKKAYEFRQLLLLKGKHRRAAAAIEDEIYKNKIECNPKDIISLIKILKDAKVNDIKLLIEKLSLRIKEGKDKGWDDIRSIPAYIHKLYSERYNISLENSF